MHCSIVSFSAHRQEAYIATNGPVSPTPVIYVHVSCDFVLPTPDLTLIAQNWNEEMFEKSGVYVLSGTFQQYVQCVQEYVSESEAPVLHEREWHGLTNDTVFKPNPYWTAFYTTRPRYYFVVCCVLCVVLLFFVFLYIAFFLCSLFFVLCSFLFALLFFLFSRVDPMRNFCLFVFIFLFKNFHPQSETITH